jgi:hypothetical protein
MSGISTKSFQNWNNNGAAALFAGFKDVTSKLSGQPEKIGVATQIFNANRVMYESINGVIAAYTDSEFRKADKWANIRA